MQTEVHKEPRKGSPLSPRAWEIRAKKIITRVLTTLIIGGFLIMLLISNRTPELILTGKDRFRVGEEVYMSDVVKEVKYGTLDSGDVLLDSSQEGEQELAVTVRNRLGRVIAMSVRVTFWQEEFNPVITAPDTLEFYIVKGAENRSFDPLEGVSAVDEAGNPCTVELRGEYDLTRTGDYPLSYVFTAEDGRMVVKDIVLTVGKAESPFNSKGKMVDGTYKTSKGYELVIAGGVAYVNGYIIVNKSYYLPSNYSPGENGYNSLRPETLAAWDEMVAAAPAEIKGKLTIRSGIRTFAYQSTLFNNYVLSDGMANALTYSAKPGHSEHHTGLAMDITVASTEASLLPENAVVLDWLNDNAWRFGFIKRYPEGKTDETGYIFEPWHYRYVGKELAEILYNNGDWITMEAFFGIDSEYKY